MKKWLSVRTAIGVGWFLVGVGLLPFGCVLLWGFTHNSEPVSEQVSLQRGRFVSPYFKPEIEGTYQISLYWRKYPSPATRVDLDWRIVDSQGAIIDQGTYDRAIGGGNIVGLGEYRPQRGVRQRMIVDVLQDVNGPDREATLEVGIPEVALDIDEGAYPLAMEWAAITTIPGIITLVLAWLWRRHSPLS
jgi:hypothetical protein